LFRGANGVAFRGIHDNDSPLGRGLQIHIVDAHAGPADDAKFAGRFNQVAGEFGPAADNDRVISADDFLELFGGKAGFFIALDIFFFFKLVHAGLANRIGDENFEHWSHAILAPVFISSSVSFKMEKPSSKSAFVMEPICATRTIFPFTSPCPPAIVTPFSSRIILTSCSPSILAGKSAALTVEDGALEKTSRTSDRIFTRVNSR